MTALMAVDRGASVDQERTIRLPHHDECLRGRARRENARNELLALSM